MPPLNKRRIRNTKNLLNATAFNQVNTVSDSGEEGDNFLRQALQLKSHSCSSGNFAEKLVKAFFQPEELVNRNCIGNRGKGQLDPNKLGMVRGYVFKLFDLFF